MTGWGTYWHRLRSLRLVGLIDDIYRSWRDDRTIRLGAGLAYYALFGIIPFITLAIYLATLAFSRDDVRQFVFDGVVRLLGPTEADQLAVTISSGIEHLSTGSLGLIGVAALIFASSLLFAALQDALNVVFGVPVESGIRQSVRRRLWLFVIVLGLASIVLASLILETVLRALLAVLRLTNTEIGDVALAVIGPLATFLLIVLVVAVLYHAMPRTEVAWRPAWIAAVTAVGACWLAVVGVKAYLTRFATTSIQGAAGGIALVLTLIYVLGQVILAAAHLCKILNLRQSESVHEGRQSDVPGHSPDADVHTRSDPNPGSDVGTPPSAG
jgi:membrane protein